MLCWHGHLAMTSHPPVPISELAEHIERLRANNGARFSAEYESIDPGQQLTWDVASQDETKPKNRYANVIAYDHSRVQLYSTGLSQPHVILISIDYHIVGMS